MIGRRSPQPRVKRRFPRLTVRVEVALDTTEGRIEAVATTLGAGGLFVALDEPLPAHDPVTVRFRLPGEDELLRFQAHVVWSTPAADGVANPGMGLEFDDVDARSEHAVRLEQWAARRESGAA